MKIVESNTDFHDAKEVYKKGELIQKMRELAVDNIRYQRERGMPKSVNAYEIGINICINGRHFDYLGSTVGTAIGGYHMTPKDIVTIVTRALFCAIKRGDYDTPFDENTKHLFLERDGHL